MADEQVQAVGDQMPRVRVLLQQAVARYILRTGHLAWVLMPEHFKGGPRISLRFIEETRITTATQRRSIINLARLLNYRLPGAHAATATMTRVERFAPTNIQRRSGVAARRLRMRFWRCSTSGSMSGGTSSSSTFP